jgi:type VI secretion system secreted protein Hcp
MAVDFFLKMDGVQGESQDANFKNQIQVLSFSWGASQVSSVGKTGGSGAGKVDLSDFSIMTNFDKATPNLFKSICAGTHVANGTFNAVKSGASGKAYLTLTFSEIFVSSLQVSGSTENPTVSLSFTYAKMKMEYYTQDDKGNVTLASSVTYDVAQNQTT